MYKLWQFKIVQNLHANMHGGFLQSWSHIIQASPHHAVKQQKDSSASPVLEKGDHKSATNYWLNM